MKKLLTFFFFLSCFFLFFSCQSRNNPHNLDSTYTCASQNDAPHILTPDQALEIIDLTLNTNKAKALTSEELAAVCIDILRSQYPPSNYTPLNIEFHDEQAAQNFVFPDPTKHFDLASPENLPEL